jgi:beta-glucosidase/6-phospho-beta-glucosidase/beta-galactosidase
MTNLGFGFNAGEFLWATGIEDTFVPQARPGHRSLDEYELMGHYEHWREDLALVSDSSLKAVRWGVPWYRVEPTRGHFDWSWIDEVISYLVDELGITPIIDLIHYGCPLWLRKEFANEEYPKAVADYAAAFADRYHRRIKWYTPLNEPLVNALMCGKRGVWPPYLRGDAGYIRVLLQTVRGVLNTVRAIKSVDENAIILQVEAIGLSRAIRQDLEVLAMDDQRRGYLFYDLISGMVGPDHSLFGWLLRHGAPPDELSKIADQRIDIELMGVNFYPQWSTKQIYIDTKGRICYREVEQGGEGFASLIQDYYTRYRVPIIITETSAYGPIEVSSRWLQTSIAAVKQLRAAGVPVIGYTWFPLFTMVDWRYRLGRKPVEHYFIDLGLYRMNRELSGNRWIPTPLVEQLRGYINDPFDAIGELAQASIVEIPSREQLRT